MKRCAHCKKEFDEPHQYATCDACRKYTRDWFTRHPNWKRKWDKDNHEKLRGYDRKWKKANPEKISAYNKKRYKNERLKILQYYSEREKPCCACPTCNEERIEFLSVDHIHGGGRKHITGLGHGFVYHNLLLTFPQGYRVLCHNCNQSHGLYGYCPHQYENLGAWWNK